MDPDMFESIIGEAEIRVIHKTGKHSYLFPFRWDTDGIRRLHFGYFEPNNDAKSNILEFSSDALRYAHCVVVVGRQTRTFVLEYIDEANSNVEELKSLLRRGWLMDTVLSVGLAQSSTGPSPCFQIQLSLRQPRDSDEAVRVDGVNRIYIDLDLVISEKETRNLIKLNELLNDFTIVASILLLASEPTARELSSVRALLILKFKGE